MQIISLLEGVFSIGRDRKIHPAQKTIQPDGTFSYLRPQEHILLAIRPFVIQTQQHAILLDTGFGQLNPTTNKYIIVEELAKHHLSTQDIDIVLLSHLHRDHIGTIFLPNSNELTYPNATYYIHQKEFCWAKQHYPYFLNHYQQLDTYKQVCLLSENKATCYHQHITYQLTGAHCPYHQVFWIQENGATIFFGGDVAPQYQQLMTPTTAKYDYNPELAKTLREQWRNQGQHQSWTFLFYHDINKNIFANHKI